MLYPASEGTTGNIAKALQGWQTLRFELFDEDMLTAYVLRRPANAANRSPPRAVRASAQP